MKDRINEWDYHHIEGKTGALSGCSYEETIKILGLNKFIDKAIHILEVGVGLGYVTKELCDLGYLVSAFDISSVGLNRVEKWCVKTYNLSEIIEMPNNIFDIIICHNVVQHIPTPYLYYELFHFIRSLAPNGIMAIKSISTDTIEDSGDDVDLVLSGIRCSDSIGCFCRSIPVFKKIVDRCGGVASVIHEEHINVDFINGLQIYHVVKKQLI